MGTFPFDRASCNQVEAKLTSTAAQSIDTFVLAFSDPKVDQDYNPKSRLNVRKLKPRCFSVLKADCLISPQSLSIF